MPCRQIGWPVSGEPRNGRSGRLAKKKNMFELAQVKLGAMMKLRNQIADRRDKLRSEIDDFNDILCSLDAGIEDFDCGMRDLQSAVDNMSQFL